LYTYTFSSKIFFSISTRDMTHMNIHLTTTARKRTVGLSN
jgi:hypothetical protein